MSTKTRGLGKGLDAIFMDNDLDLNSDYDIQVVRISNVEPNKKQPRIDFDENALADLAESIASKGVLQPLVVRPIDDGRYQIVAGERRWRASRMAGLTEIPVIVRDIDDFEAMEIGLIENLQRENLSPIEEAKGYKVLMEKYGLTQEEVSHSVGKSRSSVANTLRLLNLSSKTAKMLEEGLISSGHARAILSLDINEMDELAEKIAKEGLSVRETEEIVGKILSPKKEKNKVNKSKRDTIYDEIEISLRERLLRKVKIKGSGTNQQKGILQIEFFGTEDLVNLVKTFES